MALPLSPSPSRSDSGSPHYHHCTNRPPQRSLPSPALNTYLPFTFPFPPFSSFSSFTPDSFSPPRMVRATPHSLHPLPLHPPPPYRFFSILVTYYPVLFDTPLLPSPCPTLIHLTPSSSLYIDTYSCMFPSPSFSSLFITPTTAQFLSVPLSLSAHNDHHNHIFHHYHQSRDLFLAPHEVDPDPFSTHPWLSWTRTSFHLQRSLLFIISF